jgi:UDP-N-acetylmuramate--alanine ligase
VVDDYAHHPTEVAAALAAARARAPEARLVAVFQPHLYSRTRDFHRAFGEALSASDEAWLTAIYPAREAPIAGVDSGLVAAAARAAGAPGVVEHPELSTLAAALADAVQPGDLVLTLGAGSVDRVGPELLRILGSRGPNAAGSTTGGGHA